MHPRLRLIIAGNRDEFFARETAALGRWPSNSRILGGRDLEKGGSWLGIRDDGRFALVTNHRDMRRKRRDDAPSRGSLVSAFLETDMRPDRYLDALLARDNIFEPFNLIVGDRSSAWWRSNVTGEARKLEAGRIYGVSNALLDTPWPKVEALRKAMHDAIAKDGDSPHEPRSDGVTDLETRLFDALADRTRAPRERLPDTGVTAEVEAALSCAFIRLPGYGTRASSILTVSNEARARFVERSFDEAGASDTHVAEMPIV